METLGSILQWSFGKAVPQLMAWSYTPSRSAEVKMRSAMNRLEEVISSHAWTMNHNEAIEMPPPRRDRDPWSLAWTLCTKCLWLYWFALCSLRTEPLGVPPVEESSRKKWLPKCFHSAIWKKGRIIHPLWRLPLFLGQRFPQEPSWQLYLKFYLHKSVPLIYQLIPRLLGSPR